MFRVVNKYSDKFNGKYIFNAVLEKRRTLTEIRSKFVRFLRE